MPRLLGDVSPPSTAEAFFTSGMGRLVEAKITKKKNPWL